MHKFSFLLLLAILSCTPEPKGTQFLFALETTGTYSVQMRDEVGEFIVLDTLELKGNDAFMVQFDTARIISFLPLKGELPVIHAVVGPNSKKLTISKDGFISGDAENNWLGAQRKMQLDLIDYTDSMDAIKSTYVDSNTFVGLEALNNAYYAYADGYRQRILDSLQQHPERLSNLLTIYHRIGQQPALDYAVDRELLKACTRNSKTPTREVPMSPPMPCGWANTKKCLRLPLKWRQRRQNFNLDILFQS